MARRLQFQRKNDSAGLMMMELVVAILIFALISAACVLLFAKSRTMIRDSKELSWSTEETMNIAELLRSTDSSKEFQKNLRSMYPQLKAEASEYTLGFDQEHQPCPVEKAAVLLTVKEERSGEFLFVKMETTYPEGDRIYETTAKHYVGGAS